MGYMGFGMQRWIYSLKPKRPFSKDRKEGYDTIPAGTGNFHFGIPHEKSRRNIPLWLFGVAGLLIIFVTIFNFSDFMSDQEKVRINRDKREKKEQEQEFSSFYNSAILFYESGDWEKAKNDFEFALQLRASHHLALKYYLSCLVRLSQNDPKMSNLAINKLDSIIATYPKDVDFRKLKAEYYLFKGDTVSAVKVLNQTTSDQ